MTTAIKTAGQDIHETASLTTKGANMKTKDNGTVNATWKEILPFFIPVGFYIVHIYLIFAHQNFSFFTWCLYCLIPAIDLIMPESLNNFREDRVRSYEKDPKFQVPLYTFWVLDFSFHFITLYMIGQGLIGTTWYTYLFLILGNAHLGAINGVVGHDLLHRRNLRDKIMGTLCFSKALYTHYFIQHVQSHHKLVCTPNDSSTSHFGDSIFYYYATSVPQTFVEVWDIEKVRLERQGQSKFSLENKLFQYKLMEVAYLIFVWKVLGFAALKYQILYAILIVIIYEGVQYISHYGLLRNKDENGNWETVTVKHAWNAPQLFSGYILFQVQRHSDHHANVYKPFHILNIHQETPMLPQGYIASLIVALVPPVFKKVMDPMVKSIRNNEKVSEEINQLNQKLMNFTILPISILMTYLAFFL
eukprot:403340184